MFQAESFSKNNTTTIYLSFDGLTKVKDLIIKNIPLKNCKLLDIGSGDGKVLDEVILSQLKEVEFSTITGSDYNEGMVEFASKMYKDFSFKLLDIEKENFNENSEWKNSKNSFDILTSTFAFYLLKDIKLGFANARELMKNDGIFWCFFPGCTSQLDILLKCMETPKYSKYKENIFDFLTPCYKIVNFKEYFPKMLNDLGFKILYYEYISSTADFGSRQHYVEPVLASYVRPLPEELREELINNVVEEQIRSATAARRNHLKTFEVDVDLINVVVQKK